MRKGILIFTSLFMLFGLVVSRQIELVAESRKLPPSNLVRRAGRGRPSSDEGSRRSPRRDRPACGRPCGRA